ncbi:MAG TPA: hypothetical protein VLS93_18830 [Anaeromyxobacteraceae bacterium]|nr:hypothetical protein [Anaeromyxobacteraceae bacterium]
MSHRGLGDGYDAALSRAGFQRWLALPETSTVVYRRAAPGHWFLEARLPEGGAGHVDVGLAAGGQVRGLVGPVHRALSAAALASALPAIVASLESLAGAADVLRCPTCHGWPVTSEGPEGSFLACGQAGPGRNPFDTSTQPCRRHLGTPGLVVHGEPEQRGGGPGGEASPVHSGSG